MLRPPEHQVAGHHACDGKLGPLVDDSGHFYKPLQSGKRGSKEVAFYSSLSSNSRIPEHIRQFFPGFYGTQLLEASDGSGLHPHLVMEDLSVHFRHPSIIDIKIGARTWYPRASEDYVQKCLKKDRETTSLPVGFRISGLQVYESYECRYWKPNRFQVQLFTVNDARLIMRKFVSSNPSSELDPDCLFASSVYGGSGGILAQLLELKSWFEDQSISHFYSTSVLMLYDKTDLESGKSNAQVKLIDFAHMVEGEGVIDHNFLGGLCSLIKFISEILTGPDTYIPKGFLQGSPKGQPSHENGEDKLEK